MRISGNLVLSAAAAAFTVALAVSMPHQANAQGFLFGGIPSEGFGSGVYIDGREPLDKATRDRVDAYEQSLRDKQRAESEWQERMQNFRYGDLITRGRSEGRY